jgi:16S rRNA (guanine(966)-N(2))-methyltransferase RsmD
MRIIAGTGRGRKLSAPPGLTTRPTSDRVREALFSILAARIDFFGIRVLDMCAGSGSLGIEALSRGAGFCTFIENNRSVAAVLEKNLSGTGFHDRSECLVMDVVTAVQGSTVCRYSYDLVFFDPPYASGLYRQVIELLNEQSVLAPDGVLVAECSVRSPLQEWYGLLRRYDRRLYGETALELFSQEKK